MDPRQSLPIHFSSNHPTDSHGRRVPLPVLVNYACRIDDVSVVKQAIELASLSQSRDSVEDIISHAVRLAIIKMAGNVLAYVLSNGGSVPEYSFLPGAGLPSYRVLNLLLEHGWDINARMPRRGGMPFLWKCLSDQAMVVWAVDHGASVQPVGQEPYKNDEYSTDHDVCPPLLGEAVLCCCSISTFDLLRSKGAHITRRVLHLAAQTATTGNKAFAKERIELVRHLLNRYKLDVNALDASSRLGNHWGTPLCYVARRGGGDGDCREVTELLLQKGADPDLNAHGRSAMKLARQLKNSCFLETVVNWRNNEYYNV